MRPNFETCISMYSGLGASVLDIPETFREHFGKFRKLLAEGSYAYLHACLTARTY